MSVGPLTRRAARLKLAQCVNDAIEVERQDGLDLEQQPGIAIDGAWAFGRWSDRDIGSRRRASDGTEKAYEVTVRVGLRVAAFSLAESEDELLDWVDKVERALRGTSPYLPRESISVSEVTTTTLRTDSGAWLYADIVVRGRFRFDFNPEAGA